MNSANKTVFAFFAFLAMCAADCSIAQETIDLSEEEIDSQLEKVCKACSYIMQAEVHKCQAMGQASDGSSRFFFRITFDPNSHLKGNYENDLRQNAQAAGIEPSSREVISCIHMTNRESLDLKKGDKVIVMAQTIQAGAMVGDIPIRVLHILPETKEHKERLSELLKQLKEDDD